MSERSDLLVSVAETIQDYRAGEIDAATPEHVDRWVKQFSGDVQVHLLRELDHVFKTTYLTREWTMKFLKELLKSQKLAGKDPCDFWKNTHFLQIQQNGHSQEEMLELLDELLSEDCDFTLDECGEAGHNYVYLDDVIFSGNRVGNDLEAWIQGAAPKKATVHVVAAAIHTAGEYLMGRRLKQTIADSEKKIEINYWRGLTIENRKYYKDDSGVLWPSAIPDDVDVQDYVAQPQKFPLELRCPGGKHGPFSSEKGRQLLETEFLIAGVKIRGMSENPKKMLRPLGYSPFGVGFGSMIVTFRNCPNNCPLALWWGDPEATSGPFNWYPLLQRKTYDE